MPKLLYISTVARTLEAFIWPFADHYRKLGWQVDAMAADASTSRICKECFDGVYDIPLSRSVFDFFGQLKTLQRIRGVVRDNQYDIIHTHTPIVSFLVRYEVGRLKNEIDVKVVYTAHGFHFHPQGWWLVNCIFKWAEKQAGQWTDCLIVINDQDYQVSKDSYIVSHDRLLKVPGVGVDLEFFDNGKIGVECYVKERHALRIDDDCVVLLMIAEFSPGKRHKDILEALACCQSKNVTVLFAGAGKAEKTIKALAVTLGVCDKVRFLGFCDDIPSLLHIADCVLLPSEREGLPRSLLEAMAMSKACLVSDVRGCNDLVSDSNGYLYPCGDVQRLADILDEITHDRETLVQKGQAGRAKVGDYSLDAVIRQHDEIYHKLLSS